MVGLVWNSGASQIINPEGRGKLPRDSHCYSDGRGFVDGRTGVEKNNRQLISGWRGWRRRKGEGIKGGNGGGGR